MNGQMLKYTTTCHEEDKAIKAVCKCVTIPKFRFYTLRTQGMFIASLKAACQLQG